MPTIQQILDKGFTWNGEPWDAKLSRRITLLWLCPILGVVIGVSGATIFYRQAQENHLIGYVVSSHECQITLSDKPGGPAEITVEQNLGGDKFATCGGIDRNAKVYYDPDTEQQASSREGNLIGTWFCIALGGSVAFLGILAWIATIQKRRRT